jgi:hypothetical protein
MNEDDGELDLDRLLEEARADLPRAEELGPMRGALGLGAAAKTAIAIPALAKIALCIAGLAAIATIAYVALDGGDRAPSPTDRADDQDLAIHRPVIDAPHEPAAEVAGPAPARDAIGEEDPDPDPPRARRHSGASQSAPPTAPPTPEPESAILLDARRALATGDLAHADRALARHRTRHPRGLLIEERDSLAIEIRARRGDLEDARTMLARFERTYPRSVHRERLSRLLSTSRDSTVR